MGACGSRAQAPAAASPRGLPSAPQEQHLEVVEAGQVDLELAPSPPKPKPTMKRQQTLDLSVAAKDDRATYVLTAAQAKAAAVANKAQAEAAARTDALPENKRYMNVEGKGACESKSHKAYQWRDAAGPTLEAMLDDADLVDVEYIVRLVEAGGVVPRHQDLPEGAKITKANSWRLRTTLNWGDNVLPVFVLSYPWLDRDHPDRQGAQLKQLLPLFKLALAMVREKGGPHATFGLMMDYCCLPQKPFATDEEQARFKRGLGSINRWYAHPKTFVLLMNTPLPTSADGTAYTNDRPHARRGWCRYETRASALVKYKRCLLDFSKFDANETYTEFRDACSAMMAGRPPPMSPDDFEAEMRREVKAGHLAFTANADMEMVIEQYREGFVEAFASFQEMVSSVLFWDGLKWSTDAANLPQLLNALKYAADNCAIRNGKLTISMDDNGYKEQTTAIRAAVAQNDKICIEYIS